MAEIRSCKGGWVSKKWLAAALLGLVIATLPVFALGGRKSKLFVDGDASGEQNGSSQKPFKTISQAMKESDKNTEIHVASGTYKENIVMKEGVEIFGESTSKVIIEAKGNDEPVVLMKHKTVLNEVTVKGGKYGIKVKGDAKASIIDCTVRDNKRDGIIAEEGDVKGTKRVSISKTEIKDNGRTGIFSHKRRLSITDNNIHDNESDGIDLEKGTSAWIASNDIKDNGASGIKVRIDGSNIWTRKNDVRDNKREGMEVEFDGKAGRVNVAKSEFVENRRFGIARIQDFKLTPESGKLWDKYLTFDDGKSKFVNNFGGEVSKIIVR